MVRAPNAQGQVPSRTLTTKRCGWLCLRGWSVWSARAEFFGGWTATCTLKELSSIGSILHVCVEGGESGRLFVEMMEKWAANILGRSCPAMKGKRPGFDLAGKGQGIAAGTRHLGGTPHVERQQPGGAALPKESDTHCVPLCGQILDGEGALGQETCDLWLHGARSCRVGGRDVCVALVRRYRRSTQCCAST